MARILSRVDPATGRRRQVASVDGTFRERSEQLGSALGVSAGRASRMSGDQLAKGLTPDFGGFGPKTLSTQSLAPQADMKLPPTPAPVAAAGLQGALETQATQNDQFLTDLAAKREKREQEATAAKGDLMSFLDNEFRGPTARTDEAYSEPGGVDQLEGELKDINQQLLQEQESLRRQIERIQTAPGTATMEERDRQVREVERGSLRRQADLSIIQLARQGKYDSAKAIADRAVAVALEEQTQELQMRQFIYEENKELFTKAEQREYETQLADRTRAIEFEAFKMKADYEQKIRQSDPLYQEQLAAAKRENATAGGAGGGPVSSVTLDDGTTVPIAELDISDPSQIDALPVSDLTKSVISGFAKTKDLTPTQKGQVAQELYKVGFNPNSYINNKLSTLVQEWAAVPEGSKGLLGGLKFWERYTKPEVASFESNLQILTREIARLNDVGVLSDQDVKSYAEAMPSRIDASLPVVLSKASGISSAATGKKAANVGKTVVLADGRTAVVGLDGETLIDPRTGKPLE